MRLDISALSHHARAMNSGDNPEPFPVELPWEEYTEKKVTIEALRERLPQYQLAFLSTDAAPTLSGAALGRLLDSNGIDPKSPRGKCLHEDLLAVGLWYMLPAARQLVGADLDTTRGNLRELERLSKEIWPSLHHVLSMLPISVADHLGQMPEWVESQRALDLEMIKQFVRLLPEISRTLATDVQVRRKGRRSNFVLDHSAELTATAFHQAGLAVEPRGQSATAPSARLVGDGAGLFVDYFRLLDRHLSEVRLAQALLRNRRREKGSRT